MNRSATHSPVLLPLVARAKSSLRASALLIAIAAALSAAAALPLSASGATGSAGVSADECTLMLTPSETVEHVVGSSHSVVARFDCAREDVGTLDLDVVTFNIISGPHAGVAQNVPLTGDGTATFSYMGTVPGVDTIRAAIDLPQMVPAADCGLVLFTPGPAAIEQCDADSLTTEANVVWTAPPTKVTAVAQAATPTVSALRRSPEPSVSITRAKHCVARRFAIRARYRDGEVKSTSLFVDSRRIAHAKHARSIFRINARRYKPGRHHVEIITIFTDNRAASKQSSFTRCKVRRAAKRAAPGFTG